MNTNRKHIVALLDRAADRASSLGYAEASSKQTWFLAGLLAERGLEADHVDCGVLNTSAVLTSRDASQFIDDLLKPENAVTEEERAAWRAEQRAKEQAALDAAAARRQEMTDDTARMDAILIERGMGHLTGADRREARRLLRRELEAQAA